MAKRVFKVGFPKLCGPCRRYPHPDIVKDPFQPFVSHRDVFWRNPRVDRSVSSRAMAGKAEMMYRPQLSVRFGDRAKRRSDEGGTVGKRCPSKFIYREPQSSHGTFVVKLSQEMPSSQSYACPRKRNEAMNRQIQQSLGQGSIIWYIHEQVGAWTTHNNGL